MDFDRYRQNFFANPFPESRFQFNGLLGTTLYFEEFQAAIAYYTEVLGPPGYVEGESTRGWRIGQTWLTILQGNRGNPQNVEIQIVMATPAEAENLQAAFISAGGAGDPPSDQLMYEPIRYCSVTDPFGTRIIIFSALT
ncbi:MAG: hypothetical protein QNJ45_27205 [Ardenticatenaceae bacterium]|nr:hypothetical protein [Ardenticatenaceae bacterium]